MIDIHANLSSMWGKGVFEPAIHYIRFPVFKNLVTDMRIDFTHPVTAIVGPNGSNKTAILRSLQGCPANNDLGNYWFGTAMDAIPADSRHRFIYGRYSESVERVVEVIKTRIGRKLSTRSKKEIDPDLFEPSRPRTTPPDNMEKYAFRAEPPDDGSKTRWNTIEKAVLYLDFRSQLSAFDWAFHHSEPNRAGTLPYLQGLRIRKSIIRNRSKRLAAAIDDGRKSDRWYGTERIIEPIHAVSDGELAAIETILGKKYESVRMIHHRYFGRQGGWTVLMDSAGLHYSEAFAGSGEYAAVMLVHSVFDAKPKSLVLLDEPEVSLHPAAQRAVMEFLAVSAQRKHHQIVLATHSSEIIRSLPKNAIKVLAVRADNGKVDIPSQAASAHAAFEAVGAPYDRPIIVVEDRLAATLVKYTIRDLPVTPLVEIKFIPGGASTLWTHYLPMWAHDDREDLLLLLDGDQKTDEPPAYTKIPPDNLEQVVSASLNNSQPKLPFGSDEEHSKEKRIDSLRVVLEWRRSFVGFLPFRHPDEFLLRARASRLGVTLTEEQLNDAKMEWDKIVQEQVGHKVSADEIFFFQEMEINQLEINEELKQVADIVDNFAQGVKS